MSGVQASLLVQMTEAVARLASRIQHAEQLLAAAPGHRAQLIADIDTDLKAINDRVDPICGGLGSTQQDLQQLASDLSDLRAALDKADRYLKSTARHLERAGDRASSRLTSLEKRPAIPPAVQARIDTTAAIVARMQSRMERLEQAPRVSPAELTALAHRLDADMLAAQLQIAELPQQLSPAKPDAAAGANGKTPLFRLQQRAGRIVLEIHDWVDATDADPDTGYLGERGLVDDPRQAVDLRGAPGVALGGYGLSESRVLELIEAAMSPPDVEYPRIVATVTTAGPTTLHTPAAGKAIRVRRIKCTGDPDIADTPMLTLRLGDKLIQRGPVLYGADFVEGAVGDALILDLESAALIGVTILYEEITP